VKVKVFLGPSALVLTWEAKEKKKKRPLRKIVFGLLGGNALENSGEDVGRWGYKCRLAHLERLYWLVK
jgi:hypothetical protein